MTSLKITVLLMIFAVNYGFAAPFYIYDLETTAQLPEETLSGDQFSPWIDRTDSADTDLVYPDEPTPQNEGKISGDLNDNFYIADVLDHDQFKPERTRQNLFHWYLEILSQIALRQLPYPYFMSRGVESPMRRKCVFCSSGSGAWTHQMESSPTFNDRRRRRKQYKLIKRYHTWHGIFTGMLDPLASGIVGKK